MGSQTGADSATRRRVEPLPFGIALGHRLRQVREGRGKTATEVARRSQLLGLGWDRSTVARIELGQRQVTAAELLVMPLLYDVPVTDLLPTENVRLAEKVTATPAGLRGALSEPYTGHGMRIEGLMERVVEGFNNLKPAFVAMEARMPGASGMEILSGAHHMRDEVTVKAAGRLHATAEEVAVAAEQLWQRSLTEERDARVDAMGPVASAKARQARRGHVTRRLLEELAPQVLHVRTGEGETDGER